MFFILTEFKKEKNELFGFGNNALGQIGCNSGKVSDGNIKKVDIKDPIDKFSIGGNFGFATTSK